MGKIFQFPKHNLPRKIAKIHKILKKEGILGDYGPRLTFPDEPQFFQYACERSSSIYAKKGVGYGCSDDESEAFTASVAEAIEHYCILYEQDNSFVRDSYKNLTNIAIDPLRFVPFSKNQLSASQYRKFRVNHDDTLNWLEGYSLTKKERVLIPASLVYANYNSQKRKEPTIQLNISTGAACGQTLEFALHRGICEIIERDAYMISFICGLPKSIIDVTSNEYLFEFKRRISRYNLEVYLLDTSLDCSPTCITCLIFDRTGSGPAVSAGLGGSLSPRKAIKTAALEAVRRHIAARDRFFRPKPLPLPQKNSTDWFLLKKQLFWSAPHMINVAQKFLNNKQVSFGTLKDYSSLSDKKKVKKLVQELESFGCEVIYADVTIPAVKAAGLTVVKVLIPEMVPLWRDERYPYFGPQRLYDVPKKLGYKPELKWDKATFSNHPF